MTLLSNACTTAIIVLWLSTSIRTPNYIVDRNKNESRVQVQVHETELAREYIITMVQSTARRVHPKDRRDQDVQTCTNHVECNEVLAAISTDISPITCNATAQEQEVTTMGRLVGS